MKNDTDRDNQSESEIAEDVLLNDRDGVIVRLEHSCEDIEDDQREYKDSASKDVLSLHADDDNWGEISFSYQTYERALTDSQEESFYYVKMKQVIEIQGNSRDILQFNFPPELIKIVFNFHFFREEYRIFMHT